MITGIDHIEMVVADVDAAADFFAKLGLVEIRRTEHHGSAVELRIPGAEGIILEVHTGTNIEVPGINHIAFRVDDCVGTVEAARGAGVDVADAKIAQASGRRVASFRDPFYNRWQFSE